AAAADQLVAVPVDRVDEVVAALAEEGVGAEVAEEAVGAAVADQHVGPVGSLEALVVAADLVGVAAAAGTAAAAQLDAQAGVRAAVGDGVVARAAGVGMALADRDRGDE